MTTQVLFTTAKRTVERRRQIAETAAIQAAKNIYAAVPMLAQLDALKTAAGSAAARHAVAGETEQAEKCLAEMRDIAQRRKLLLQQHGYAEQALEPNYTCKICSDKGQVEGRTCECVYTEMKRLRRANVNEAGPLTLCRFENFSLDYYPETQEGSYISPRKMMAGIMRDCQDYAADFGPYSDRLYMFGNAGLGKTHLALSIASVVLDKGLDAIYVSAQSAFANIAATRWEGENSLFNSMLHCDLLVLDDLGTEYLDAYTLSRLYELVNGRMRKPTIYTTNICTEAELMQRYTEKISSRLMGECHPMRFWGRDIRQAQK